MILIYQPWVFDQTVREARTAWEAAVPQSALWTLGYGLLLPRDISLLKLQRKFQIQKIQSNKHSRFTKRTGKSDHTCSLTWSEYDKDHECTADKEYKWKWSSQLWSTWHTCTWPASSEALYSVAQLVEHHTGIAVNMGLNPVNWSLRIFTGLYL